jgi:hypothetical protein
LKKIKGKSNFQLRILRKTVTKLASIAPKYIVVPEATLGLKTHELLSTVPGYHVGVELSRDVAKVHHYRLMNTPELFNQFAQIVYEEIKSEFRRDMKKIQSSDYLPRNFDVDNSVHVYKEQLLKGVARFFKNVPSACGVDESYWLNDEP